MIDLIELYVEIDDFCKKFTESLNTNQIGKCKPITINTPGLSLSEVLTILIYYHFSKFDCIKHYYLIKSISGFKEYFPKMPSYNRFVERIPEVAVLAIVYLQFKQTDAQISMGIMLMNAPAAAIKPRHGATNRLRRLQNS